MIHAGWSDIVSLNDSSADSSISYSFDFAESKALDFKRIPVGASLVHFRTVWVEGSLPHPRGESLQAAPPQRQLFKKPPAQRRHPATCSLSPFQGWTPRKLEQSFLLKSSLKRPLVEEDIVLKTEEILNICHLSASQVAQLVKNHLPMQTRQDFVGSIPGLGRSLGEGNGNPLRCSCLENLMDRKAWQAIVNMVVRIGHDLACLHGSF